VREYRGCTAAWSSPSCRQRHVAPAITRRDRACHSSRWASRAAEVRQCASGRPVAKSWAPGRPGPSTLKRARLVGRIPARRSRRRGRRGCPRPGPQRPEARLPPARRGLPAARRPPRRASAHPRRSPTPPESAGLGAAWLAAPAARGRRPGGHRLAARPRLPHGLSPRLRGDLASDLDRASLARSSTAVVRSAISSSLVRPPRLPSPGRNGGRGVWRRAARRRCRRGRVRRAPRTGPPVGSRGRCPGAEPSSATRRWQTRPGFTLKGVSENRTPGPNKNYLILPAQETNTLRRGCRLTLFCDSLASRTF